MKEAMSVTTRRRVEAAAPPVADRWARDEPGVDDSPRWIERHKRAEDRGVSSARVHRKDAAATVRGVRRN